MQPPDDVPHEGDFSTDDDIIQATQELSQLPISSVDQHLWGYLQPCSNDLTRLDFWKIKPSYTIGRGAESSIILPGIKVSECIFSQFHSLPQLTECVFKAVDTVL
jgi:serine/threonine/tyrosine protein kinase RAD53